MNKIKKNKIILFGVAASLIILAIILWHPWITTAPLESIEAEFNEKLGVAQVAFITSWEPLGMKVEIYGYIGPETLAHQIGYFHIDLFGHTDYIYTPLGKIPAWWCL